MSPRRKYNREKKVHKRKKKKKFVLFEIKKEKSRKERTDKISKAFQRKGSAVTTQSNKKVLFLVLQNNRPEKIPVEIM